MTLSCALDMIFYVCPGQTGGRGRPFRYSVTQPATSAANVRSSTGIGYGPCMRMLSVTAKSMASTNRLWFAAAHRFGASAVDLRFVSLLISRVSRRSLIDNARPRPKA